MPSVFISYSRRDGAFASRLHDALAERGYDVWIDREDIPPSAKWFDEIRAGVAGADGVVFVISPDSAASEVCVRELELAADLGKRIVPAVCREPDGVAVPEAAASLNWVFLRDSDDFAEGVATLTRALETDLDHVRTHTRLGVEAGRWEASGRDPSQLLRGAELTAAENWLVSAGEKQPPPTSVHREYVLASRTAATRRQRGFVAAVSVALVVAIVLGVVALVQRSTAIHERNVATARFLDAAARQISISTRSSACCSPCARRRSRRAAPLPRSCAPSRARTCSRRSTFRTRPRRPTWSGARGTRLLVVSPGVSARILAPGVPSARPSR